MKRDDVLIDFCVKAREVFDGQKKAIERAFALRDLCCALSKELIHCMNLGDDCDAEFVVSEQQRVSQELYDACVEISQIRKLGRSSYLRFIALQEAVEAFAYQIYAKYIFDGSLDDNIPSLERLFSMSYTDNSGFEPRRVAIFSHTELCGSIVKGLLEVVGEIHKGITSRLASSDYYSTPEKLEQGLKMCQRGIAVANLILRGNCELLADTYSHQIDKFVRRTVHVMNGSVLGLQDKIIKFQLDLVNAKNR